MHHFYNLIPDFRCASTPLDRTKSEPEEITESNKMSKKTENASPISPLSPTFGYSALDPSQQGAPGGALRTTQAVIAEADLLASQSQDLAQLRQSLKDFEGCALKRTATNLVFGEGKLNPPIMLVGEAPGADEDLSGSPFVGMSGKLLEEIYNSIGYKREDIYISNIVPWRPPGNRQPSAEEISICLPFIIKHIKIVQPKILVLVGGVSAKAILNRAEGIMRLRGQWFDYFLEPDKSILALATFHPSYLLRSPGSKRYAWQDWLKIKAKIKEK